MNRRSFLAVGALPPLALAQDRLRIAFMGTYHAHALGKLQFLRRSPDWQVVGFWDNTEAGRRAFLEQGVPELTLDAILKDPAIPAVAIESDVALHAEHTILALRAGKHIHLEKPPAATLTEFSKIQALAKEKGRLVQLGYQWRYSPALRRAIEAVRAGWLGDVYLVKATHNTLIDATRRPEWARFRGGQMFEQGAHLNDTVVRMMGRPGKVTPFLRKDGKFDDTLADNTVAIFEWPSAVGILSASVLQPNAIPYRAVEIFGRNGTITVRPAEGPAFQVDLAKAAGPYQSGMQEVKVDPFVRYVGDFAEFAQYIRTGKPLSVTPAMDLDIHSTLMRACAM